MTDWLGILLSVIIILLIFTIIVAKIQGDKVVDVFTQILEAMKGGTK